MGEGGIVNMKVEMSGTSLQRNMILSGYIRQKHAEMSAVNCQPLLNSCMVVDRESASSAELYAVLSRIRSSTSKKYSVTGSVNQRVRFSQ